MRIIATLVEDCPKGFDCPRIYATDGAGIVVQGYVLTARETRAALELVDGHDAVRVSRTLVDAAIERGVDVSWLRTNARGDLIAVGARVAPSELVLPRPLPAGEQVVVAVTGSLEDAP